MDKLRENIAENIVKLRVSANMTQAQLADKLNYSDKAVSKWERGESVPDIVILKQIADMFSVTVDWVITEHRDNAMPKPDESVLRQRRYNHLWITLLSAMGVWLLATVVFALLAGYGIKHAWLAFLFGVPFTFIDLLVFNAIWGRYRRNFLFISLIIWTMLASIFLLVLAVSGTNIWFVFVIGVPLQLGTIFWSQIRIKSKKK